MKTEVPKLPKSLKKVKINSSLLNEVVNGELANRRQGTADAKTRAQVSGGGRKPWRQKGTGRARAGSRRSPIWKGGGVTFGPTKERNFSKKISKKKKKQAIQQVIARRIKEGNLKIADEIKLKEPKTRMAVNFLKGIYKPGYKNIMIVIDENKEVFRAFRNINNITLKSWRNINTYNIIKNERILFTGQAWENMLNKRIDNE